MVTAVNSPPPPGSPLTPSADRAGVRLGDEAQGCAVMVPQQVVQRSLPLLERQIDDVVAARPPVIDLVASGVQVVDSAGLNWLLSLHGRLETLGIRLRLVNPSGIMADALTATRLDARLTIQNTEGVGHVRG